MKKINFINADSKGNLKNAKTLKTYLSSIFTSEKTDLNFVDYIFCSDLYLLEINRKFLNHDFFTDVITFSNSPKNQPVQSEIYISIDRIKENAKTFKKSYQNELVRVMIHGILHLCGYDDKSNIQKTDMRQLEDKYLEGYYNVPREI